MDYGVMDYGDMNWLAIVCAGLTYWLLGAVWYSALFLVRRGAPPSLRGLKIGAGVGLGFCATALTMTYVWQSPPRRLWAIDTGYHIVGCIIMGAILSVWR
jgi:hypothetical protein